MSGVSVERLRIGLRAPGTLRSQADTLKSGTTERFLPAVLSAAEARLAERFGARAIIDIAKLRLRLRISPGDLNAPDVALRLGEEVAEGLVSKLVTPGPGHAADVWDAPMRAFRTPAERHAARLIALSARRALPSRATTGFPHEWRETAKATDTALAEVIGEVYRLRGLAPLLKMLTLQDATDLADRIASKAPAEVVNEIRRRAQADTESAGRKAPKQTPEAPASPPETTGNTAEASPPPTAPRPEQTALDQPQTSRKSPEPDLEVAPEDTEPGRASPAADKDTAPPSITPDLDTPAPTHHEPPAIDMPAPPRENTDPDPNQPTPSPAPDPDTTRFLDADWCGLLYLVNLALAVDLPERLWRVGLREGDALATMLSRIAGTTDPASHVIANAYPKPLPDPPEVRDWAREELCTGLMADDRIASLGTRIHAIDAHLRDAAGWDLSHWGAALLLAMAEDRLGDGELDLADLVSRFALPGRILIEDQRLTVIQPLEAIDIDMRRAGLDRNPGWLPWIERELVFEFADQDEEEVT